MSIMPTGIDLPLPKEENRNSALQRKAILASVRTIAMVGASADRSRPSYFVSTYLLSSTNYEVWFVNPKGGEILGRPVYQSLDDLPGVPDLVDVFRKPADCPGVATAAVALGASALWLQLGVVSEEAATIARSGGLQVVMDRCIKIEHARFAGGLHLAGFDTGVISAKRGARL
jgi:uncharacterized protein